MKKILFVIQSFPSKRSANVLCDEKIIRELNTGKYEIHCLVSKFFDQSSEEIVNGIHIHRINRGIWWKIFTWAKGNQDKRKAKIILKVDRILLRIKQVLTIPIYPNTQPLLARKVAKNACVLQKKENFDLVIAEHHGFETLYAGAEIKRCNPSVKFMPIFWDPLTGKEPAKYIPANYSNKKNLSCEKRLLSIADKIIAMKSSESYHKENSQTKTYYDKYVFLDLPCLMRPNETDGVSPFLKKGYINILYSGVLTLPDRDPTKIINILNQTKCAEKIHLLFFSIGNGVKAVENMKGKFKGTITVHNYVKSNELNQLYRGADVLLNLGGSNPIMLPSKIFTYMSYGKPIISTIQIDRDGSQSYLDKYGNAVCVDIRKSIKENADTISDFLERKSGGIVPYSDVEKMFVDNKPEKYLEVIQEIINDDSCIRKNIKTGGKS